MSRSADLVLAGLALCAALTVTAAPALAQYPPGFWGAGPFPPGSYLLTCANPKMVGTTLQANCIDDISFGSGGSGSNDTSLTNAAACKQDINNYHGNLSCGDDPNVDPRDRLRDAYDKLRPQCPDTITIVNSGGLKAVCGPPK